MRRRRGPGLCDAELLELGARVDVLFDRRDPKRTADLWRVLAEHGMTPLDLIRARRRARRASREAPWGS